MFPFLGRAKRNEWGHLRQLCRNWHFNALSHIASDKERVADDTFRCVPLFPYIADFPKKKAPNGVKNKMAGDGSLLSIYM